MRTVRWIQHQLQWQLCCFLPSQLILQRSHLHHLLHRSSLEWIKLCRHRCPTNPNPSTHHNYKLINWIIILFIFLFFFVKFRLSSLMPRCYLLGRTTVEMLALPCRMLQLPWLLLLQHLLSRLLPQQRHLTLLWSLWRRQKVRLALRRRKHRWRRRMQQQMPNRERLLLRRRITRQQGHLQQVNSQSLGLLLKRTVPRMGKNYPQRASQLPPLSPYSIGKWLFQQLQGCAEREDCEWRHICSFNCGQVHPNNFIQLLSGGWLHEGTHWTVHSANRNQP